ncbi:MAG: TraM recognition domain-containing protein [Bryobacteraceae bacterium]|nr:TraM recognition domain-containing protein [Bryobacteraceae bacterium]
MDYPLFYWSQADPFRLRDAVTGTLVFGATGSGKTSGAYRSLLRTFFLAGYGGIIFTTKPGEYEEIRRWAEETGRLDSLIRFAPEEKHRFSFLTYESTYPGRGGAQTENIVKLLTTVQESFDRNGDGGGKQERFWKLALEQLLRNAIDLRLLARPGEPLSVRALYDVIVSAPTSPEQLDSEAWQQKSACYRLLDEAINNDRLSPQQKSDLEITGRYFLSEFPSLPQDTRGSIISTFTTMADIFLRGQIGTLFSNGLTIVPEVAFEGGIIVIDIPIKTFGQVGIASQTLWKFIFQQACERRDVNKNPRPVFIASDECHNIVNQHDASFLTTARSSRCCSIYMTQSYPNLVAAMGGDHRGQALAESFAGASANRIFCANTDPKTNEWAASVFAKSFQSKFSSGINRNDKGGDGSNAGASESLEYLVQPAEFVTLAKGGPENRYLVEAIVSQGGRVFNASGTTFLKTAFRQI